MYVSSQHSPAGSSFNSCSVHLGSPEFIYLFLLIYYFYVAVSWVMPVWFYQPLFIIITYTDIKICLFLAVRVFFHSWIWRGRSNGVCSVFTSSWKKNGWTKWRSWLNTGVFEWSSSYDQWVPWACTNWGGDKAVGKEIDVTFCFCCHSTIHPNAQQHSGLWLFFLLWHRLHSCIQSHCRRRLMIMTNSSLSVAYCTRLREVGEVDRVWNTTRGKNRTKTSIKKKPFFFASQRQCESWVQM